MAGRVTRVLALGFERQLARLCEGPARYAVQQLDKPEEAQLAIGVADPVMENCMYGH